MNKKDEILLNNDIIIESIEMLDIDVLFNENMSIDPSTVKQNMVESYEYLNNTILNEDVTRLSELSNQKYEKNKLDIAKGNQRIISLKKAASQNDNPKIKRSLEISKQNLNKNKEKTTLLFHDKVTMKKKVEEEKERPTSEHYNPKITESFQDDKDFILEAMDIQELAFGGEVGTIASVLLYDTPLEEEYLYLENIINKINRNAKFKNILYQYGKELDKVEPNREIIKELKRRLTSEYRRFKKV